MAWPELSKFSSGSQHCLLTVNKMYFFLPVTSHHMQRWGPLMSDKVSTILNVSSIPANNSLFYTESCESIFFGIKTMGEAQELVDSSITWVCDIFCYNLINGFNFWIFGLKQLYSDFEFSNFVPFSIDIYSLFFKYNLKLFSFRKSSQEKITVTYVGHGCPHNDKWHSQTWCYLT